MTDRHQRETLELLREIRDGLINPSSVKGRPFPFMGNADMINKPEDSREVRGLVDVIESSRSTLEREKKGFDSFFKGIGRSIPVVEAFASKLKKNSDALNKSIEGQSKTYSDATKAMESHVRRVGVHSRKLETLSKSVDQAERAAGDLQNKIKKRGETESKISELTKGKLSENVKLRKDLRNLGDVTAEISRAIKTTKDNINKIGAEGGEEQKRHREKLEADLKNLTEALSHTKALQDIPKAADELRDVIKNIDTSKIDDPAVKKILEDVQKDATNINKQTLIANIDKIIEVMRGIHRGGEAAAADRDNKLIDLAYKSNRILENLGSVLVAGFVEIGKQQLGIIQTRQLRAGGQFQQIIPALEMGMSEADLLRVQDERRYLLRRMARAETGTATDRDFVSSDMFRTDIHELGKQMGFRGVEAMDAVLDVAESLRVVGIDATRESLANTIKFIKQSHKQFGITQEQMVASFKTMTEDGLLAIRLGGAEDVREAMEDEVEARMRLARLLNQDIAIQERRAKQMAGILVGDPAETFRKSIMVGMLGGQIGMGAEDRELLQRHMRGETLSGPERERAMHLYEEVRTGSAERRADAITGGNLFGAYPIDPFMRRAGIDIEEATRELALKGAGMFAELAETDEPVKDEMHMFARSVMRAREVIDGILKSSFGVLLGGLASSALGLFNLSLSAAIAGHSLRTLGLGRIGGAARGVAAGAMRATPLLAGAAMVGHSAMNIQQMNTAHAMGNISDLERRQGTAREVGGTAGSLAIGAAGWKGGALLGAKIGAAGGPIGAGVGGLLGAGVGGLAGYYGGQAVGDAVGGRMTDDSLRGVAQSVRSPEYRFDPSRGEVGRRVMGEVQTADLTPTDRARLEELQEQLEKREGILGTEIWREHASPGMVRKEEAAAAEIRHQMAEIQGAYFGSHEGFEQRRHLFDMLDMYERHKEESLGKAYDRDEAAKHYGMSKRAMSQMIGSISDMEGGELLGTFQNAKELEAIYKAISKHDTRGEHTELLEKLLYAMVEIEENTDKSANIDEKMYNEQQKKMAAAGEDYWWHKLSTISGVMRELSTPSENIGEHIGLS